MPEQRITLEQAIEAYTMGVAYAGKREKSEGSIQNGKLADMIVVDQDLFATDPHKIDQTKVMVTMVGGKVVYAADGFGGGRAAVSSSRCVSSRRAASGFRPTDHRFQG